eukprot:6485026-Amphidinium_carterae.2
MTSAQKRSTAYFAATGESPPPQNKALDWAIFILDMLCDDIEAEHRADPVKLIGLYCCYCLISVLYFIRNSGNYSSYCHLHAGILH